jgi:acyl-CoA reductase-like NAD-dependent aldehyde dehydrogenase
MTAPALDTRLGTTARHHPARPFGGCKRSGCTREVGLEVFDNDTEVKVIKTAL